jgi:hypothetical protein
MMPLDLSVGSPSIGTASLVAMSRPKMIKARMRHTQHRCNSRRRGVPFELSFASWLAIWMASGFWHKRGRRVGQYVMSRPGDHGGYVEGNVAIVLVEANHVEGSSHPCAPRTRAKIARRLKGNTNGAGHVASGAASKRMRQGCAERGETAWLANTTAANQAPAKRRVSRRAMKDTWDRQRDEVAP